MRFFRRRHVRSVETIMSALANKGTWLRSRIRRLAGVLLLPYLAWLAFAAFLNIEIGRLNPEAETLVAPALKTQVR